MCAPWVMHWFPGMTPDKFAEGWWSLSGYVAMLEFVTAQTEG